MNEVYCYPLHETLFILSFLWHPCIIYKCLSASLINQSDSFSLMQTRGYKGPSLRA